MGSLSHKQYKTIDWARVGGQMELAVFPPYVAEVSSSPRPTLKVDSGKLLNGANGTGSWISIHSIGDIGPQSSEPSVLKSRMFVRF